MANKPLNSIKFPTLPDVYEIPNKDEVEQQFSDLNDALDALGLSVVNGCLCATYTE